MTVEEIKVRLENGLRLMGQKDEQPRLRLSQLTQCPRKQWFDLMEGAPESDTDDTDFLIRYGHFLKGVLFERWLSSLFPEGEWQKEVEFYGIKGHIDLFVPPKTALEVKVTTTAWLKETPFYEHLWQLKAYLAALKSNGVADPQGFLIYIPADNPALMLRHIYPVTLTDEDYETLKRQVFLLVDAEGEPPMPDGYSPDKLPCRGLVFYSYYKCPYFERCWKQVNVEETSIVPRNVVDDLGRAFTAYEQEMQKYEQLMALREQIFEKVRQALKDRPHIRTLEIEGEHFKIVATRYTYRRLDVQAMRSDLGDDFLKPYEKETPAVRVQLLPKP